ncbi:MAG: hypothetical protein NTAFB01_28030 [Nitrospira sp.]
MRDNPKTIRSAFGTNSATTEPVDECAWQEMHKAKPDSTIRPLLRGKKIERDEQPLPPKPSCGQI